jgi:hypothetical protein
MNVCFWPKADIETAPKDVRFRGNSGHRDVTALCLLMTQSGHAFPASLRLIGQAEAENLRASLIILGVVALVLIVWQCVRQ